jgi:hypothetical protein
MERLIDSPIPIPSLLVVKNASKSLSAAWGGETDSRIFHAKAHPIPLIAFGSDQQFSRAIVDSAHRIRSIPQQIQNDLLKLDAIADDGREVVRKLMPQTHTLTLELTQRQRSHLSSRLIQVHRFRGKILLAIQRA